MENSSSITRFNASGGFGYFTLGFKLIRTKGLRRFVFIPLTINLILFSFAFYYLVNQLAGYIDVIEQWVPDWLSWLSYIVWPLAVMVLLIIFSFVFSTFANWIAAPFNGLLSEKLEIMLTQHRNPSGNWLDIVKDIPRTLGREWRKLVYYLPRAIGFFLIMWILPFIGQCLWFVFTAWIMAIQYLDYPFDNHKIPFHIMKNALKEKQRLSYSFGFAVTLFSMIPLINLIVMPVAICGATALWVDHYRKNYVN